MQQDQSRNGKQRGILSATKTRTLVQSFREHDVGKLNPGLERPVKQAILRGVRSKLPGVRRMAQALLAQIHVLKLAEVDRCLPNWWKVFWKSVRNAVRRAGQVCHEVDGDEVSMMQYMNRIPAFAEYQSGDRFWVARMLQKELELLQAMGKGIGAKLRQLLNAIANIENALHQGLRDLSDMLRAVVVSFQDDEGDEHIQDAVDQWVQTWLHNIQVWMDMEKSKLENVVIVEDSLEVEIEDAAKKESGLCGNGSWPTEAAYASCHGRGGLPVEKVGSRCTSLGRLGGEPSHAGLDASQEAADGRDTSRRGNVGSRHWRRLPNKQY